MEIINFKRYVKYLTVIKKLIAMTYDSYLDRHNPFTNDPDGFDPEVDERFTGCEKFKKNGIWQICGLNTDIARKTLSPDEAIKSGHPLKNFTYLRDAGEVFYDLMSDEWYGLKEL